MNLCYRELPGSTELRELIDRTMLMSDEDFEREHNWDREEREDFMLMLEDDARELDELEGIEESEYSIHDVDGALTTAPWQWFTTVVGVIVTVPMWVNVYRNSKKRRNELV